MVDVERGLGDEERLDHGRGLDEVDAVKVDVEGGEDGGDGGVEPELDAVGAAGEFLRHDAVEGLAGLRLEERPEPAGKLDEVVAEDAEERPGVEIAAGEPGGGAARRLGHVLVTVVGRGAQGEGLEPAVGMVDLAGILPARALAAGGDQRPAELHARRGPVLEDRARIRARGRAGKRGRGGRCGAWAGQTREDLPGADHRPAGASGADWGADRAGHRRRPPSRGTRRRSGARPRRPASRGASSPRGRGASNSAKVSGTSPGCSGRSSRISLAADRVLERGDEVGELYRARCCRCCRAGRARPRWRGRGGRGPSRGSGRAGRSEARITPSTMSPT